MKQKNKKIAQLIFTLALVILFIIAFGLPAIIKYRTNEVFLKIATEPDDRSKIEKITLPALTFCGSDLTSIIFQVDT